MNRQTFVRSSAALAAASSWPIAGVAAQVSGETILEPFASAPFPHASRAHGHTYQNRLYDAATHYSDSTVAIYVPPNYRRASQTDFIVHFHGWNNDVANVLGRYRLREQLAQSGRNAVLVVPQGPKDAPDSGDGKLELDDNGFARFMTDVATYLHRSGNADGDGIGRIVLTAHSGGYGGAGGVLTRGGLNAKVTDVVLFDAAYGYFDAFAGWATADASRHFLSVFTDDTSTGNAALMGMLQAATPNLYIRLASRMSLALLQTRVPTFVLTTDVAHDELLQRYDWYALFLRATALEGI